MKLVCTLGRIASIESIPDAKLIGDKNASKWVFEVEHDSHEFVTLEIKFLDYTTGKPLSVKGRLEPSYVALNLEAACAKIFFPVLDPNKLRISIAPAISSAPTREEQQAGLKPTVRLRLTVDAVHSLMR